ncbi:alpha-amylase family protein [Modestobacter lapidis]|nr:hypothetical protein [Modestobacter lapidis]
MIERIGFGPAQLRPGRGRPRLRPGETLALGLGVSATSPGELAGATAFVWTNHGAADPRNFSAVAMAGTVPADEHQRAFEVTLPPAVRGTFVATGYVVLDGVRHWAQEHAGPPSPAARHGLQNRLVYRVSDPAVDATYVRQVPIDKANARADSTDISTIEDMLETGPGWYTLRQLADEGVTCVWVQVPYRLDPWDGLAALDDAGSDYASTDWFSIDPELSREARAVPPWDRDRQRELANAAMTRFVAAAHALGMAVISEIAPNHVGHNYVFRDVFGEGGSAQVRRRDYSQVALDAAQLAEVAARLASPEVDEGIKDYAEHMLPQLYATRGPDGRYDPRGAGSVHRTYSPDWYGRWADTKHLNHGGHAGEQRWVATSAQNQRVLDYIGRAMRWAVTELGFDGFRVDHALGMPFSFFEQVLPVVEMEARRVRGADSSLLIVLEDHDRKDYSARVGDVVQSKGYEELLHALADRDVDRLWRSYGAPLRDAEFSGTGNHDEIRGSGWFGGDLLAYGTAVVTMRLMGGPMTTLAGDEYAEGQQLRFKSRGGVPTLWQLRQGTLPAANTALAARIAAAARLASSRPALRTTERERLGWRTAAPTVPFACARSGADPGDVPLLLVSNLDRTAWVSGQLDVGSSLGSRLAQAPDSHHQVLDLLGTDPDRPMWRRPLSGRQLLEEGLPAGLQPCQVQVLELQRVH